MVVHRMAGCKEMTNLLSSAGFISSYTNVYQEMKKLADDARNDSSFAPATIPKGQSIYVTINNSNGRQQTGVTTTHHTKSTIYVPKLVTHPTEDTSAESYKENMGTESSREIYSPSPDDISNENAFKVHLLCER